MTAQIEATESLGMNRRDFLTSTAAVGGALVLGFRLPATSARADAIPREPWYRDATVPEINAWLTIAPDDTVTIRVAQTEMGTGVLTSCPMMVVEELQCDWSKVRAEYASLQRDVVERAPEWTLKVPGGGNPRIRDGGGEPSSAINFKGVSDGSIPIRADRSARAVTICKWRVRKRASAFSLLQLPCGRCPSLNWWRRTASSLTAPRGGAPPTELLPAGLLRSHCPIRKKSKSRVPTSSR